MKVPGLIDLQVNGYMGMDFSDINLTEADFIHACEGLFEAGTTAFLPTLITSPMDIYRHNLPLIASVLERPEFSGRLLGIHLEGPFISTDDGARGAHNAECVREPDVAYLEKLIQLARGRLKMITIAAELTGAQELARYSSSKGITVSLGHQMADEADLARLVRAGATVITHLGNGVPAMLPRHINPIWAGLANDDLDATIITDGHHLPASVIKTIIRAKGTAHCIVVSDATSLAGCAPGRYKAMGHSVVLEENGRLYDPTTEYLVGSSSTILQCMNFLASLKLVNPTELIAMAFYNPLKIIGLTPQKIFHGRKIIFDKKQFLMTCGS
jgi:N-acetylglucosamine-6-phosphate deacetylase